MTDQLDQARTAVQSILALKPDIHMCFDERRMALVASLMGEAYLQGKQDALREQLCRLQAV
jgi:hypothetical protein